MTSPATVDGRPATASSPGCDARSAASPPVRRWSCTTATVVLGLGHDHRGAPTRRVAARVTRDRPGVAPGAATGIGSLPGTDPAEAAALVLGELPDLPHLPELPGARRRRRHDRPHRRAAGRPAGRDQPSGWRLAAHPAATCAARATCWPATSTRWRSAAAGYARPAEGAGRRPVDAGRRARAARRAPRRDRPRRAPATWPSRWPRGCARTWPRCGAACPAPVCCSSTSRRCRPCSAAGCRRRRATARVRAVEADRRRAGAGATCSPSCRPARRVVHCCAADVPIALLRRRRRGRDLRSTLPLLTPQHYDALGEAVEAGVSLWLGVVRLDATPDHATTARPAHGSGGCGRELGFARRSSCAGAVVRRRPAGWPARSPATSGGAGGPARRRPRPRRCRA